MADGPIAARYRFIKNACWEETTDAQAKNRNRGTALERPVGVCGEGGGDGIELNRFYSRPLILMQLQITNICLVRITVKHI